MRHEYSFWVLEALNSVICPLIWEYEGIGHGYRYIHGIGSEIFHAVLTLFSVVSPPLPGVLVIIMTLFAGRLFSPHLAASQSVTQLMLCDDPPASPGTSANSFPLYSRHRAGVTIMWGSGVILESHFTIVSTVQPAKGGMEKMLG